MIPLEVPHSRNHLHTLLYSSGVIGLTFPFLEMSLSSSLSSYSSPLSSASSTDKPLSSPVILLSSLSMSVPVFFFPFLFAFCLRLLELFSSIDLHVNPFHKASRPVVKGSLQPIPPSDCVQDDGLHFNCPYKMMLIVTCQFSDWPEPCCIPLLPQVSFGIN